MDMKKSISFTGVFSIATGAMISSGIFILPGFAFSLAGPAVVLSYFLAGVLGLTGILAIIELSTAMPKSGGDYYFINKALGPAIGTMSGVLGWIALSLKSAFAIFGLSELLFVLFNINIAVSSVILVAFFVTMNIVGIREAALFQILMVAGLVSLLIVYIISGVPKVHSSRFVPFFEAGINNVIITSGFVFISFGGLLKVANISEEVKNPTRNIPLGLLASIGSVTIIYTLVTLVIVGTLDAPALSGSLTPVADSAAVTLGEVGFFMIIGASALAFFTTANAGIMAASRYPLALSKDQLAPKVFGRVSGKSKTPIYALVLTGGFILLSLLLPLEMLVKSASTVVLTSYVLTNISVIILRESHLVNYRPSFKAPLYPYLQILCILIFTFFIIDLGMDAVEISLGLILVSFLFYLFYGKRANRRESALIHLMKRLADERITGTMLEDELREILVERDQIVKDSFDQLVSEATVIDVEESVSFEELVKMVADDIAALVGSEESEIVGKYIQRQKESNTAVSPFLAIPHIIIEGTDKSFLFAARCRRGAAFTEEQDSVKAVFLLGGSADARVLHLKTIAAIATLVSTDGFAEKWMEAGNEVELKSLMLLSRRKRYH